MAAKHTFVLSKASAKETKCSCQEHFVSFAEVFDSTNASPTKLDPVYIEVSYNRKMFLSIKSRFPEFGDSCRSSREPPCSDERFCGRNFKSVR